MTYSLLSNTNRNFYLKSSCASLRVVQEQPLRRFLAGWKKEKYPSKTCLLDPFLWLLFFHDWGYLYQVPALRQKQFVDLEDMTELEEVLKGSLMAKKKKTLVDDLWNLIRSEYAENLESLSSLRYVLPYHRAYWLLSQL